LRHWILHEAGIALLEIALIAALAVSLARWTWVALTPGAAAATAAPEQLQARPSTPVAQRHLFGVAITAAAPVADAGGLTLLGVFSDRRPGAGRAILARQGGKPVSLVVGESIAEGLVLREVYPDHVIVLRDGAPHRVELERRASAGAPAPVARLPVRK
jgi:general secretion pathway protein C